VSGFDQLPDAAADLFGAGATAAQAYGLLTVDVPAASWIAALTTARDTLGCTFFDWLSAVDEPGTGFLVSAHLVALGGAAAAVPAADPGPVAVRKLLLRTTVPYEAAELPTATGVYAGAAWHERETYEMFGVAFAGHPHPAPLLLPEEFEGHPLRKDFVLAARVVKAWPGAKEPGESHDGGPKRRQMQPPGVPDPNEWGPLKGQLPPAPARAARTPRAAGAAAAGERPARRTRSASEGSASQGGQSAAGQTEAGPSAPGQPATPAGPAPDAPAAPRKRTPDAPWQQPPAPEQAAPERPPAPEPSPAPEPPAAPEQAAPEPPPAPEPPAEGGDTP
jgi:NADH:ubiquinone oxidoreductase subunit C